MPVNYWAKFEHQKIYHVYNRSINRERLFREEINYEFFLEKWKRYLKPYLKLHAYCLMPNHFHFLVYAEEFDEHQMASVKKEDTESSRKLLQGSINFNDFLEDQFKRFLGSFVLAFNKRYFRRGSLLQKRFKRVLIDDPIKYQKTLCYIHHNPIHHGFCEDYNEWKFSSYNSFFLPESVYIERSKVLNWMDPSDEFSALKKFNKLHETFMDAMIQGDNLNNNYIIY